MTLQPQQFGQLKMFMTGPEIKEQYAAADAVSTGSTQEQTWRSKLNEAAGGWEYDAAPEHATKASWRTLSDDIDREGVKTPVHVYHGYHPKVMPHATSAVFDGHHRAAYEAAKHPDRLLPVWHSDDQNYKNPKGA